jgi:hypothetical protein
MEIEWAWCSLYLSLILLEESDLWCGVVESADESDADRYVVLDPN